MQGAMDTATRQRLKQEYFENRIRSAHPLELVVMLYDTAIESLNAAIGYVRTQDRFERSRAVTRAEQAVHELLASLDHSVNAPFTHTLASLYHFCLDRMVAGHSNQSEQAFQEALSVLSTLGVAWREIAEQTCHAPAAPDETAEEVQPEMVSANPYGGSPYGSYGGSVAAAGSRNWSC